MQGTRTPSPPTTGSARPHGLRIGSGRLMSGVASLLTVLAALGAVAAVLTSGTEADLYWFFAGVVAVIAAVVWLVAIILLRPTRRVVPVVAAPVAVLIAAGVYAGLRDGEEGIPLVAASVVVLVVGVATLLWNRAAAQRR